MRLKTVLLLLLLLMFSSCSAFYENVDGYRDCVEKGYPVQETYPEKCVGPDDTIYINIFCDDHIKFCSDGSFVEKEQENNCEFARCPFEEEIVDEKGFIENKTEN